MYPVAEKVTTRRIGRSMALTGTLNATPEEVFEAWIRSDQLAKWWLCDGAPPVWCEVDARAGGHLRVMGSEQVGRWVFLEVVRNRGLILTDAFDDAWSPSGQAGMVCTVLLEGENGRTRYRLDSEFWQESDAVRFEEEGGLIRQAQAFERLAALVEES